MPSTCEKPWATSLAFLRPSDLMLKTHLQPMVLRPFGKSVSLKILHQQSASSSSLQAIFYSSCAAFGKRIRSLKCHSRTLVTSGIFPLASADETAALSRKFVRLAPPSCSGHFLPFPSWGGESGLLPDPDGAGTPFIISLNSSLLICSDCVGFQLPYTLSGQTTGFLS
jgi:hypothetical protein